MYLFIYLFLCDIITKDFSKSCASKWLEIRKNVQFDGDKRIYVYQLQAGRFKSSHYITGDYRNQ